MDQERLYGAMLQLRHRHADGSWGALEEHRAPHDPAQADPERGWPGARLFRCRACAEEVEVVSADDDRPRGLG